jgi:L-seryl-tRNA(Ser) seleniumtransferase
MTDSNKQNMLRAIPPVDELLGHADLAGMRAAHPNFPWTRLIRTVLDDFRCLEKPPSGLDFAGRKSVSDWILNEVKSRLEQLRTGGQKRVINGTGVILHTNLGRAVLGETTADAVHKALRHYVNLETDPETGKRGRRAVTLDQLVCLCTGGEASLTVNNNAAAVYLVASTFSPPGRIIVSRGELVEIGGSFRLPEILRHAAEKVVEVGTTNRTYAKDYAQAAGPGDLILKVHKSNYAIEGFAHEASCREIAEVAREKHCRFAYDLGSGALFDYRSAGVGDDARVEDILSWGVDCVTMSGDKLLGGVQSGIIAGKKDFLDRLKQNPLRRAVRIDKVVIAALQDVLRGYLFETDPAAAVPLLKQILGPVSEVEKRADAVVSSLRGSLRDPGKVVVTSDAAAVGGGSLSSEVVPSVAITINCEKDEDAVSLARSMRLGSPPIYPRVKGSEVRINMRSILSSEDDELGAALTRVLTGAGY